jgi:sulfite exporter TauE/SafE
MLDGACLPYNFRESAFADKHTHMTSNSDSTKIQKTVLVVLTLALLAWGTYHAVGAYFGGFGGENLQHDFRRSLVVLACMGVFLASWWLLMLTRKPRNSRTDRPS